MQSFNDRYIHELTPENILDILKYSAWRNDNQSITSSVSVRLNTPTIVI